MTTLYTLTTTLALANVRSDLNDAEPGSRWTDAQLNRAIDRANERYSRVNPWIRSAILNSIPKCQIYGWPSGALWVDRVEYPQGLWPKRFMPFLERKSSLLPTPSFTTQPNTVTPSVSLAAGGALGNGNYQWAVTYLTPGGGETLPSSLFPSPPIAATNGQEATLFNLPIGPYGTSDRNVYRTKAGGATLYLAGNVGDNQTTTYLDTTADSSLVTTVPVANTTQDIDQFELVIPPELWPQDNTSLLEVAFAAKHHLDTDGTTIPERHWEVLYQGALAFAMLNYLPQVNDNFVYADGHLRDRVDDTASTVAWHQQCREAMADFENMLKIVKEEANAGITTAVQHWGDKPLRWERL